MADWDVDEDEDVDESACLCTPEQRETGGFRSWCPIHGTPRTNPPERKDQ